MVVQPAACFNSVRFVAWSYRPNGLTTGVLRPGVELVIDRPHPLFEHVRVDLRRREIRVAEHHLDRAQIGAALEQVRRKRMPQHVRAERAATARLPRVALQDLPEPDARQAGPAAARVDEQPRALPLAEQRRPRVAQVPRAPTRAGLVADRDDALLVALSRCTSGTTPRGSHRPGGGRRARRRASRWHRAARSARDRAARAACRRPAAPSADRPPPRPGSAAGSSTPVAAAGRRRG